MTKKKTSSEDWVKPLIDRFKKGRGRPKKPKYKTPPKIKVELNHDGIDAVDDVDSDLETKKAKPSKVGKALRPQIEKDYEGVEDLEQVHQEGDTFQGDWYGHGWNATKQARAREEGEISSDVSRQLASTIQVLGSSTSRVIGRGLDYQLLLAVSNVHQCSSFFLRGMVEMMAIASDNGRRVFSNTRVKSNRTATIDNIYTLLLNYPHIKDGKHRPFRDTKKQPVPSILEEELDTIVALDLDKAYIRQILAKFFTIYDSYVSVVEASMKDPSDYIVLLGRRKLIEGYLESNETLYGRGKIAKESYNYYTQLLDMICAKYYKSAFLEAVNLTKSYSTNARSSMDKDDLFKKLVLSLVRALDRYNYSKGTFTSFVKFFFKDAKVKTSFDYDYAQVFSNPSYKNTGMEGDSKSSKMLDAHNTFEVYDEETVSEIETEDETSLHEMLSDGVLGNKDVRWTISMLPDLQVLKMYLGIIPNLSLPKKPNKKGTFTFKTKSNQ